MTKLEHLHFLLLMIPTFVLLIAAVVSMADLANPAALEAQAVAMAQTMAAQATEDQSSSDGQE